MSYEFLSCDSGWCSRFDSSRTLDRMLWGTPASRAWRVTRVGLPIGGRARVLADGLEASMVNRFVHLLGVHCSVSDKSFCSWPGAYLFLGFGLPDCLSVTLAVGIMQMLSPDLLLMRPLLLRNEH